jgi:protein involved in polysaccharide export with SLBB domain
VLHRLKADRTLETQSLDLAGIMAGTAPDVPLRNEDVLFIMTQEDLRQERTFTITGEVMSPGDYEYAANTTIQDLIVMAGGLRDQASLAKVEVSRRILDPYATAKSNVIAKTFTFDLKDGLVMTGSQGFVLEPYDVVHVYRSPAFSAARNISVRGEVNYEGNFTLPTKKMRISDALKMAGGVTDAAYLRGARLIRQMNAEERMRAQSTVKALRSILTERGDSIDMAALAAAENTYLVGINLEEAVNKPGSDKDILMREGDELFIPEYCGMVRVSGDVFYPNVVTYEEGKSAKYYVNEAGGYGNRAKKSKTFIVYPNGNVGVVSKGAKPEPGCEIIVPSKKRRNPLNLASIAGIGTSLASLATMIIALTKL